MEQLTIKELAQNVRSKKVSAKEVFEFFFKRAEKFNPKLNSFIRLNSQALKESSPVKEGLLQGVPIGVKDLFCTKGIPTTAGSQMLKNFIPPYSATLVSRLQKQGALIIGKCNQDEFAMGSTGQTSHFGPSQNPWNTQHTAGGSSGGSASAVAAKLCAGAFGTDTGGSVRQPAHFCHLVGIKPSYGRISRYGMIAYSSSLDQAGTFSQNVEDGALLLDAVTGSDTLDSTTAPLSPTQFHKNLNANIPPLSLGYFPLEDLKLSHGEALDSEIIEAQDKVLRLLEKKGCKLKKQKWPYLNHSLSVYYLISTSEASSNLARYDGVHYGFRSKSPFNDLKEFYGSNRGEGFGKEVKQRILIGTFCLSSGYYEAYYKKACQVRTLIKKEFENIFKTCDAIVCPVSPTTAIPLSLKANPLKNYLNDIFTVSANLAGLPALSLPVTFSKKKLPIGIQLVGDSFQEQKILNLALFLEKELDVWRKTPDEFS